MVRRALAARAREFCLGIDPPDERLASVVNYLVDIGVLMVTCYSRGFLVLSRLESVAASPAALATGLVRRCLSGIGVLRGNVTLPRVCRLADATATRAAPPSHAANQTAAPYKHGATLPAQHLYAVAKLPTFRPACEALNMAKKKKQQISHHWSRVQSKLRMLKEFYHESLIQMYTFSLRILGLILSQL